MGLSWIEHSGKRILVTKYSPKNHDENIRLLEQQGDIERANPDLLILSDYRGTTASMEYMDRVKAYGKELRSRPTDVRNAVLGIDGVKRVLFRAYLAFSGDKHTRAFDTEDQARDWLVS